MNLIKNAFFVSLVFYIQVQNNNPYVVAKSNYRKYLQQNTKDSIVFYLNKMKSLAISQSSDSLLMDTYDQFAYYNYHEANYQESTTFLIQASNLANKLHYQKVYLDMINNLGMIFSKINEYEKSKQLYKRVLQLSDSTKIDNDYLSTLLNLGSAYQNLGHIDSSKVIFKKAIEVASDKKIKSALLKFIAKNYLLEKDYPNVITTVNEIEEKYSRHITKRLLDDAFFYRAQAFFYSREFKKSEDDFKKMFSLMNLKNKDPSYAERILFFSKLKKAQKKYDEAIRLLNEAIVLRDSLDEVNLRTNILKIERKYEIQKREKENLELRQEASLKDLTISKKNNIILVGTLVFIIIVFIIVTFNLIRYRKRTRDLQESIAKRTALEKKLNAVRENIAEDFHDELGNRLASITVLTNVLEKKLQLKKEKQLVNQIQKNSDELYKGTKDFIWSLKSNSDELEELATYLSDFGEDFFSYFKTDFTIIKDISTNIKLPYYWNRQIILIFKEAMTNIVKHSNATNCILSFYFKNKLLRITIADNGKGFNQDVVNQGNGLRNMEKRAKKLKANLRIGTSEKGTKIIFEGKLP